MKAEYSKLHKQWIVTHPERPDLIIGAGYSKIEAEENAKRLYEKVVA